MLQTLASERKLPRSLQTRLAHLKVSVTFKLGLFRQQFMDPKNTAQPVPETLAQLAQRMNWDAGKPFFDKRKDAGQIPSPKQEVPAVDRYFAGQIPSPKQEVPAEDLKPRPQ